MEKRENFINHLISPLQRKHEVSIRKYLRDKTEVYRKLASIQENMALEICLKQTTIHFKTQQQKILVDKGIIQNTKAVENIWESVKEKKRGF